MKSASQCCGTLEFDLPFRKLVFAVSETRAPLAVLKPPQPIEK